MKIKQQAQQLHDIHDLIQSMMVELELNRNLIHRMFLKHGNEMEQGLLYTHDCFQFGFEKSEDGEPLLTVKDLSEFGMVSTFEKIKQKYKEMI